MGSKLPITEQKYVNEIDLILLKCKKNPFQIQKENLLKAVERVYSDQLSRYKIESLNPIYLKNDRESIRDGIAFAFYSNYEDKDLLKKNPISVEEWEKKIKRL